MSLQLTDVQKSMVATVRDFAAKECGTREKRLELTNGGTTHHSPEIARKLADLGFLGLSIPEEYGGAGGSLFEACLFVEELAYNQIPVGSFGVTLDAGDIILSGSLVPLADAVKGDIFEMTLHGVGSCTAKFV